MMPSLVKFESILQIRKCIEDAAFSDIEAVNVFIFLLKMTFKFRCTEFLMNFVLPEIHKNGDV